MFVVEEGWGVEDRNAVASVGESSVGTIEELDVAGGRVLLRGRWSLF